jgi:CHRD domain-containing protein
MTGTARAGSPDFFLVMALTREYIMTFHPNNRLLQLAAVIAALGIAGCAAVGPPGGTRIALSGDQEIPPNKSGAAANGAFLIGEDGSVSGAIKVRGMAATAAHIHDAAFGTNGPVIVPLVRTADDMFSAAPGARLTAEQYADYKAGKLYVNVHSKDFPGGEIRSQLAVTMSVALSGDEEVPRNGSFATGKMIVAVAPDNSVYGRLKLDGVSATAVSIHDGSVGEDGGPVMLYNNTRVPTTNTHGIYVVNYTMPRTVGAPIIPLVQDSDGSWVTSAGARLTDKQLNAFDNGLLYVNVATNHYPKGEIRGQLSSEYPLSSTPFSLQPIGGQATVPGTKL